MQTFKKLLLSLLSFVLLLTNIPTSQALVEPLPLNIESSFTDVWKYHHNFVAIEFFAKQGILEGYSDGTFGLGQPINRAELLKLVVKTIGIHPDPNIYKNCFPDVKEEWFAPYICYAKSINWVNGHADGLFKPGDLALEGEALKIILNPFFQKEIGALTKEEIKLIINDSEEDLEKWYIPYEAFAKAKNLTIYNELYDLVYSFPINRENATEQLFRSKLLKEAGWKSFSLYLRDLYLEKKDMGDLIANVPLCYELKKNEDFPFVETYLKNKYKLNIPSEPLKKLYLDEITDQPQLMSNTFCRNTNGDIIFYNTIISKENWEQHLMAFNDKGIIQKDETISCSNLLKYPKIFDDDHDEPSIYTPSLHSLSPETVKLLGCFLYKDKNDVTLGDLKLKADVESFEVIEFLYSKDKNNVYCGSQKLDADPETFEIIQPQERDENGIYKYTKDKDRVYLVGEDFYGCKVLESADPKDFDIVEWERRNQLSEI